MRIVQKVVLLAVVIGVQAVASAQGNPPYGQGPGGGHGKPGAWRQMAFFTPGVYRLLDRLNLTEDQQNVLDEIAAEWNAKHRKADAEARKKSGELSAEDYRDPAKARAVYEKYNAAMKEANVAPPTDQIAAVLTPEQLGKILEVEQALAAWKKWLADHMAKYDKMLDEAVGPAVKDDHPHYGLAIKCRALENYTKGAAALSPRLALGKEQIDALHELATTANTEYQALSDQVRTLLATMPWEQSGGTHAVLNSALWAECGAKQKKGAEKILADAQKAAIVKGLAIIEERDKPICERLAEVTAKVEKVLPRPKAGAAGARPGAPGEGKAGGQ